MKIGPERCLDMVLSRHEADVRKKSVDLVVVQISSYDHKLAALVFTCSLFRKTL